MAGKSSKPIQVNVPDSSETLVWTANQTLLEALDQADISISHSCGGNGICGTCSVKVQSGLDILAPMEEVEKDIASDRGFGPNERLSCQTRRLEQPASSELTIEIVSTN